MKEILKNILMAVIMCISVTAFTACTENASAADIGLEAAETLLSDYLSRTKGFGDGDFLAEPMSMVVEGESVYVFSWRIKEGENADRIFGTYAVSIDGESVFEYQPDRGVWIEEMTY